VTVLQVKREHSKSLVALRTLERKMARVQETETSESTERERGLASTTAVPHFCSVRVEMTKVSYIFAYTDILKVVEPSR
jgi:hypothetical protein